MSMMSGCRPALTITVTMEAKTKKLPYDDDGIMATVALVVAV